MARLDACGCGDLPGTGEGQKADQTEHEGHRSRLEQPKAPLLRGPAAAQGCTALEEQRTQESGQEGQLHQQARSNHHSQQDCVPAGGIPLPDAKEEPQSQAQERHVPGLDPEERDATRNQRKRREDHNTQEPEQGTSLAGAELPRSPECQREGGGVGEQQRPVGQALRPRKEGGDSDVPQRRLVGLGLDHAAEGPEVDEAMPLDARPEGPMVEDQQLELVGLRATKARAPVQEGEEDDSKGRQGSHQ